MDSQGLSRAATDLQRPDHRAALSVKGEIQQPEQSVQVFLRATTGREKKAQQEKGRAVWVRLSEA